MEELEAIREAEEAALRSAEAAAEEAAAAAMSLDIIDEEELMKPGKVKILWDGHKIWKNVQLILTLQLWWNYYYFIQNLYLDDVIKNLWTV